MFEKIRSRLLLSYLFVLVSILSIFAIGVRVIFARSLTHQLTDKLTVLGEGASANTEWENGRIKFDTDFNVQTLIDNNQGLQLFDNNGNTIFQQGKFVLAIPLSLSNTVELPTKKKRIQGITLPVIERESGKIIGYIRVSQSLDEIDETLNKLNLGLGSGIIIALIFSGVGGVILTRLAMQPIEDSFKSLKQFTADASHEFRSPLMAIKSNLAVALKYPEGMRELDAEKFQAIASAANQMTQLTEDLLLLARTDKVASINKDSVNLTVVLDNLVQLYQSRAELKQINLKFQITENINLVGDSNQLTRLFTNLIQNALHYTPSGGTVEITANRLVSYCIVSVRDTGVGIAPEQIKLIFERFWRADESRSYWNGGSGLGLAIAQTIAQNHGGSITVTSKLGVSSCFTVKLPDHSFKIS
ncbi:HAMP domain-containing histidine kinase [Tychonema sp. LEGE 07203]|uniref:HAMP domain-containing sensor histidine kinase n=1 Tax=Tychonema sp. LEGE 07203 TaxID=1828671 RepID=UPI001882B1C0|nr:HAMP domain-containing histidine kinase [Tychonema sp. LEGE 07203]MBE9093434.1 sensor histidine kinase [Tychonema sp. LEGE 07203]